MAVDFICGNQADASMQMQSYKNIQGGPKK